MGDVPTSGSNHALLSEMNRMVEEQRQKAVRRQIATDLALANTAEEFCMRLVKRMVDFEEHLDQSEEVGLRLVSFGQDIQFHVRDIAFFNPSLIIFGGVTEEGNEVELIQHVSQISFLLMAVKRLDPNEPKREMGFHVLHRKWCGSENEEQSVAE